MNKLYFLFLSITFFLLNLNNSFSIGISGQQSAGSLKITSPDLSEVYAGENLSFSIPSEAGATVKWKVFQNEVEFKASTNNSISFPVIQAEYRLEVESRKDGLMRNAEVSSFVVKNFAPTFTNSFSGINTNTAFFFTAEVSDKANLRWQIFSGQTKEFENNNTNKSIPYTFTKHGTYTIKLRASHKTKNLIEEVEKTFTVNNSGSSIPEISSKDISSITKNETVTFTVLNASINASFVWKVKHNDKLEILTPIPEDKETFSYKFKKTGEYQILVNLEENGKTVSLETNTFTISSPSVYYDITATAGSGGSISPTAKRVLKGENITFNIIPNENFRIKSITVNNVAKATSSSFILNITEDKNVNVTFEQIPTNPVYYDITATAGSGGSISPTAKRVLKGENITFNIIPNENFRIKSITVNNVARATSSSFILNITEDKNVNVTFEQIPTTPVYYDITATAGSGGSISPTAKRVLKGENITFNIIPNENFRIKSITVNNVARATSSSFILNITEDKNVNVTFEQIPTTPVYYDITATAGSGGSISPTAKRVLKGENITFNIIPNENFRIKSITVNNVAKATSSSFILNITEDKNVNVTFEQIPTNPVYYDITATAGSGGSISPTAKRVLKGENITFNIIPNENFRIKSITVNNVARATSSSFILNITEDKNVNVTFEQIPTNPVYYDITATAGENGSITATQKSVLEGASVTFIINPNKGFRIKEIKVNGVARTTESSFTLNNISEDKNIIVAFEEIPIIVETFPFDLSLKKLKENQHFNKRRFHIFEVENLPSELKLRFEWKVYIDDELVSSENKTTGTFGYTFRENGKHKIEVTIRLEDKKLILETTEFTVSNVLSRTKNNKNYSVSPNPATDYIKVQAPENSIFSLCEIDGRIVKKGIISTNESIRLNDLPKGIYILKIQNSSKSYSEKIILQ